MNKTTKFGVILVLASVYILSVMFMQTFAQPVGVTVTNITTLSQGVSPDSRTDEGGTITIMNVAVNQQNFAWKAYVGNITATLTLDDSNGFTIYDWSIAQASLSGELYATRWSSITWTNISCANQSIIASEQSAVAMSAGDSDSINQTFNYSTHPTYVIAGTTLTNGTCRSLYTHHNRSSQVDNESSSVFSEIIVQNVQDRLIYVTQLETDMFAYSSNATNNITYDFQLIVAENDLAGNTTTYYFYAEIDS